jgi:hypothetical protein
MHLVSESYWHFSQMRYKSEKHMRVYPGKCALSQKRGRIISWGKNT